MSSGLLAAILVHRHGGSSAGENPKEPDIVRVQLHIGSQNLLAKVGPAAHCSKANKGARLVERKVCFISKAGKWWGGQTPVQSQLPPTDNQGARAFISGQRGLHIETAQSALTVVLKLVLWWSDHHHLDCFKYS